MSELLHNSCKSSQSIPDAQDKSPNKLILEGYLRREELAAQLCLSPRTISRWAALQIGPPRIRVGRTVLYSIESAREWLASQEQRKRPIRDGRGHSEVKR